MYILNIKISKKTLNSVYIPSGSGFNTPTQQPPYHDPEPPDTPPDVPRFGPNICDGHFDTIGIFRGEMFVFKVNAPDPGGVLTTL